MIEYRTGDIFDDESEALVNTVNCVGVMGRGLSLQFKRAYPENFKAYAAACKREEVRPGKIFVFEQIGRPRYIFNFPTKRHWRAKSRIEDIEEGLRDLVNEVERREIESVALPALGTGLGELAWEGVRSRVEQALGDLPDVHVVVYEPSLDFVDRREHDRRPAPPMTLGRAALVGLMQRYLEGGLDPFVTLLEVHKLMYFMQCAGEPLRLRYTAARYGPYAENLRHVLNAVEGHFVSGYSDGGDEPTKRLTVDPKAHEAALAHLDGHPKTRKRFDRVADLVEGFESSFGLELLATVHWVVENDAVATRHGLVERVYCWDPPKKYFTERQIGLAADRLAEEGWTQALEA